MNISAAISLLAVVDREGEREGGGGGGVDSDSWSRETPSAVVGADESGRQVLPLWVTCELTPSTLLLP